MNVPRLFKRHLIRWRTLHKAVTICVLVSLLAGLIPPPLVRSALPAPVADLADALLPQPDVALAASYSYEVTPNQAIPDNTCPTGVTTTINVPDDFTINDLNVGLTIDHAYRNDLDITLISPGGTSVVLWTDIGSDSTQNFDVLLNDEAAADINTLTSVNHNTGLPNYENSFNPEGAVVLSVLDGQAAQGNWTLRACDDAGGDTGTVRRVSLQFDGTSTLLPGHITGKVFRDYDSDGVKDSATTSDPRTDGGVAGVTVTAYDVNGAAYSAVTDSAGAYDINAAAGTGPFRVEFTTLPSGYYPTFHNSHSGSNSTAPNSTATTAGTTVQFVPAAGVSNLNLGINRPEAYAQSGVRLALPLQLAGDQSETSAILYDWPYTNSGATPTARTAAQASQIGTVWGLAYQKATKTLFASTAVRRHAGLGSLGLGGIYQIDYASGSPVASTFVDLDAAPFSINFGALGSNSARGLPTTPTTPSQDATAFAAVAKQGIGDIDLSEDGNTLWAVNLNGVTSNVAGTLLTLNVTGGTAPTSATSYAISSFSGLPTCTNGVLRPWALKFANSKGYLGAVCSAELSGGVRNNLVGYVLSFDPNAPTAFTTELTIPLNYNKGNAMYVAPAGNVDYMPPNADRWYPWTDTYTDASFNMSPNELVVSRPTPVLADIEFDENGNLLVGFLDRAGMQLGSVNYPPTSTSYTIQEISSGDTLRACVNGAGVYTLESNGVCGGLNGAGVGNGDGPSGGEYYFDSFASGNLDHQEIFQGGLAVLAGTGESTAAVYDPVVTFDTAGVLFLANSNGSKNDSYQIGPTSQINTGSGSNGYFGKSYGIGDIELLADPAPIEIGNRVWNDADSDGLQDPNEAPISGVIVELYKNGVKVGQATTDAQGEYYFVSGTSATDSNTNDNIIHDSGLGILPGTGTSGANSLYEIRIPNVNGGSKQAALGTNALTTANAGGNDSIDSDGAIPSGQSYAGYAIPYADLTLAGYNNHTYDFGFGPATGTIQIVKNTVGANGAFAFTSTDSQLDAVSITTVGNTGNSGTAFTKNAGAYTISEDALPANWALTNLTCSGDSDSGSTITLASRQVVIDLDAGEAIVCTFFSFR